MKKIVVLALCAALVMAFSLPASAVAPSEDLVKKFYKKSTAYSSETMNAILESCGVQLTPEAAASVPSSYAKVANGAVKFNSKSVAYSPSEYHSIFTAYGLQLSPEDVAAKLGSTDYAKVSGGKIVFGKKSTAYSGDVLAQILSAYTLPATGAPVAVTPAPSPTTPAPAPTTPAPAPAPQPVDTDNDGVADESDVCPGTPAGARIDERGCWVLSQDYMFDFDKATIKSKYYPILDDVVKVIMDNPALRVLLEGHTDSIGSEAYNQGLSERRAKAVQQYLIKAGVDSARLSTVGYGESRPIAPNNTKEGRAKNRRVELTPQW